MQCSYGYLDYPQSVNRFKFNGKESQGDFGLGLLDYGARMYDSEGARWLTPDPLAEKYYPISPYAYVVNNPVRYVDPKGMDVWEFDDLGNIVNRIKDETMDAFYMTEIVDGKRQRTGQKLEFEYGTVKSQDTYEYSADGDSYDVFEVRGDEQGTQLFEFMADNTSVEWGHYKTGTEGACGLNFLTTSHDKYSESGSKHLYMGQLQYNYTIREHNHNHPSNDSRLSPGDRGFANQMIKHRIENGMNIPIFNIYTSDNKSYNRY